MRRHFRSLPVFSHFRIPLSAPRLLRPASPFLPAFRSHFPFEFFRTVKVLSCSLPTERPFFYVFDFFAAARSAALFRVVNRFDDS